MNLFRLGRRAVIVDFAHNEAGTEAIPNITEALASRAAGETAPIIGIAAGGMDTDNVPLCETEPMALEAELVGSGTAAVGDGRVDAPRVVVLFCHEARDEVFALLERLGARSVAIPVGHPAESACARPSRSP